MARVLKTSYKDNMERILLLEGTSHQNGSTWVGKIQNVDRPNLFTTPLNVGKPYA